MEKEKKVLVGLGLGFGGLLAFLRLAKAKPKEGPAATISAITILDELGNPVPRNSPALVVEGSSYIARFTVTNTSTRLGAPIGATLGVSISGMAGITPIPFPLPWSAIFGPSQPVTWDITFTVPDGTGGQTGDVTVVVTDPVGNRLAQASEPLTIERAAIVYGATVTVPQVL